MKTGKFTRKALALILALTLTAGMIPADMFAVQARADEPEDILIIDEDASEGADTEAGIIDEDTSEDAGSEVNIPEDVIPGDAGSEANTADRAVTSDNEKTENIPDIENDRSNDNANNDSSYMQASGTDSENTLIIRYVESGDEVEAPTYEEMTAEVKDSKDEGDEKDDNTGIGENPEGEAFYAPEGSSTVWEGLGTQSNPYKIATAADLKAFANDVNIGYSYEGKYFILTDDIDLSSVCGDDMSGVSVSWVPIGAHSGVSFGGTFNGDGKKITNLFIDEPYENYRGLFGNLTGTIENLTVAGSVTGKDYVGGIVGCSYGSLTNCRFVNASDTEKSTVTGHDNVGGIAGYSGYGCTVENCECDADISGTGSSIGGIVGWANNILEHKSRKDAENPGAATAGSGEIKECIFSGSLIGRMPNHQDPVFNVENGNIAVSYTDNAYGGVVGWSNGYYLYDCKNTGTVDGDDFTGGIAGDATNGSQFVKCKNSGKVSSERGFLAGGIAARLGKSSVANPVGTGFDPSNRNENESTITGGFLTGGIVGFADKDSLVANCSNINPAVINCEASEYIGGIVGIAYCDIYDCVNNGSVSGKDYVGGVAGYCTQDMEECHSKSKSVVTGSEMGGMLRAGTGGVAGRLLGNINKCTNEGKVTGRGSSPTGGVAGCVRYYVTDCKNTSAAVVVGDDHVGGVVGRNGVDEISPGPGHGRVSKCTNEGKVTSNSSYAGGVVGIALDDVIDCINETYANVKGQYEYTGGVAGSAEGEVKNCINKGKVQNTSAYSKYTGGVAGSINGGKTADNCLNAGTVTGKEYTGGIAGITSTLVANSNNEGKVSGTKYIGGIVGEASGSTSGCTNKKYARVTGSEYVGGVTGASTELVNKCKNAGSVTATGQCVGGVSGYATGAITDCIHEATGTVTGVESIGGIAGKIANKQNEENEIKNCSNSGKIVGNNTTGGIVGTNEGKITDCFNKTGAEVKGDCAQTGGIAGINEGTVNNCVNHAEVFGYEAVTGGIVGLNQGTVEGCRNESDSSVTSMPKFTDIYVYAGGIVGFNEGAGIIKRCQNRGSVTGSWENIDDIEEYFLCGCLGGIAGECAGNGRISECTNYMDITGSHMYVGGITGFGSGKTYIIEKCSNEGRISGIFSGGIIGNNGGTVDNCKNTGSIVSTYFKDQFLPAGGIVGYSTGTIIRCINEGPVSGEECCAGIAGYNKGTIKDSKNNASINGKKSIGGILGEGIELVTNCINTGSVTGSLGYVGGIAGVMGVDNSTKTLPGTIEKCSNSGTVSSSGSTGYIGGIVGFLAAGEITNCSNSGQVTGQYTIGGIVGRLQGNADKCSNSGSINCTYITVGGISGLVIGRVVVSECKNAGTVTGDENVGGIVGCLEGSLCKCSNETSGTVNGNKRVGGIVGKYAATRDTTVTNCYNRGNVGQDTSDRTHIGGICGSLTRGRIELCYNMGTIKGYKKVGGISGDLDSDNKKEIIKCINKGNIYGGDDETYGADAAGIAGYVKNGNINISQCSNRGDVEADGRSVGGIVGEHYSGKMIVQDCYNSGTIKGYSFVAGIDGLISTDAQIIRCHNWTATNPNGTSSYNNSDAKLACGSAGVDRSDCFKDCYYSNVNGANYDAVSWTISGWVSGKFDHITEGNMSDTSKFTNWDFANVWIISTDKPFHNSNNGPVLRFESSVYNINPSGQTVYPDPASTAGDPSSTGADGPEKTTLIISSVDELKAFRDKVNGGDNFENVTVILGADIDLAGEPWKPIGNGFYKFSGTFDGRGHSIYNLSFNSNDNRQFAGLFGYITDKAKICNLEVSGSVAQTFTSEDCYYGGIVGYNKGGTVEYCAFYGTVSGTGQNAHRSYTGGIVGRNSGTVNCCCFLGGISSEDGYGGGIIGLNESGTISDCYRYTLENTHDTHSGSIGKNGKIVGYANGGSATDCYFEGTDSDRDYFGGKSDSGLQMNFTGGADSCISRSNFNNISMFKGWDFNNEWAMGDKYPMLRVLSYQVTLNTNYKTDETNETKSCWIRKLNAKLPRNTLESGNVIDSNDRYVSGRYYFFENWNTKADGSGTVYEDMTSISSDLTLYAQWIEVDRYYDRDKAKYEGYDRTDFGGLFDNRSNGTYFANIDPGSGKNIVEFHTPDQVRPSGIVIFTHKESLPTKVVLEARKHSTDSWVKILETDEIGFPKENNKRVLLQLDNNTGEYCFYRVKFDKYTYFYEMFLVVNNLSTDVRKPKITLNANGGRLAPGNTAAFQEADNRTTPNLIDNPYVREGFVFAGWNTKADGSGTAYADGVPYTVDGDSTLYAQWTAQQFTIKFMDDDGTTVLDTQTLDAGTVPVYKGGELNKEPDGTVKYIFSGWTPEITAVTGNKTYTATYAVVNKIYNVTLTIEGQGTAEASPTSGISGTWVNLSATPSAGYKFREWKILSGTASINNNRFKIINSDVEIQAVFEEDFIKHYTYTGLPIKPDFHIYDETTELVEGRDYKASYKNNKNVGKNALIRIKFKGGYKGTPKQEKNFSIEPAVLGKDAIAEDVAVAANGREQKPVPAVIIVSSDRKEKKNGFTYEYNDAKGNIVSGVKEPGRYTVTVKSKDKNKNVTGQTTAVITVTADKKQLLSRAKVTLKQNKYVYAAADIVPAPGSYSLTLDGAELKEGVDYKVSIRNNRQPGKAKLVFSAIEGNAKGYAGTKLAVFKIVKGRELLKQDDKDNAFTYTYKDSVPYLKEGAEPRVTVRDGTAILKQGRDYSLSYSKNKAVTDGKTAVVTVKGKGLYKGRVELGFGITAQDIEALISRISVDDKAESKKGYKDPAVEISDLNGYILDKDKDYELLNDYTGPDADGTVTVTLKGKGNYTGSTKISYRYIAADKMLKKVKAGKIGDKTYTGKKIKLTDADLAKALYTGSKGSPQYLVPGKDFKVVVYYNNKMTGTAEVVVRGIGSYGGIRTLKFKIKPARKDEIGVIVD